MLVFLDDDEAQARALTCHDVPDWRLLSSPRGGHWLCGHTAIGPVALVAPGVSLGIVEDDIHHWRRATWRPGDADCEAIDLRPPDAVAIVSLAEVAELAGPTWEPWVRRVTAILLERTYSYGFIGTPHAPVREERARSTQIVYTELADEARIAFPDLERPDALSSPRGSRAPATPEALLARARRGGSALQRLWAALGRGVEGPPDAEATRLHSQLLDDDVAARAEAWRSRHWRPRLLRR